MKNALLTTTLLASALVVGEAAAQNKADISRGITTESSIDRRGLTVIGTAPGDLPRGTSIFERTREEYDPAPMRLGSFVLSSQANLSAEYTDNLFFREINTQEDMVYTLGAGATLASDWVNHSLALRAGVAQRYYQENNSQDNTDYLLGINGAVDILRGFYLEGGLDWQTLHENFDSPNSLINVGLEEGATQFERLVGNLKLVRDVGLLGFEVGASVVDYDYEDDLTRNNDDRDRTDLILSVKPTVRLAQGYRAYVEGSLNFRDYDTFQDDNGFQRDSDGYGVIAGTEVDLTGLITADVYAGLREQTYDDPTFDDVEEPVFGTSLLWSATPLTSVRGSISRSILESVLPNTASFVQTKYAVEAEHELKRNFLLRASASYAELDFQGNTGREDEILRGGIGARYLFTPHFNADLGYQHNNRDSSANDQDYDQNSVRLGLNIRY